LILNHSAKGYVLRGQAQRRVAGQETPNPNRLPTVT